MVAPIKEGLALAIARAHRFLIKIRVTRQRRKGERCDGITILKYILEK
jgi:hypothetical protein